MIDTLLDACAFILNEQGEPQSCFWLASQAMEMKLWKTTEGKVRTALNKDIEKYGELSRFAKLDDDEFALRSWSEEEGNKSPLPFTPAELLHEIKLAIADALAAKPFGPLAGTEVTDANLFHLAPLVGLKFRGREWTGQEAERVTKVALANYIANTDPEGVDRGLEHQPWMAFTLCYVAAHLALDLLDEQEADEILTYCENYLVEE